MIIRRYQPGDEQGVCELYRETTRIINGRDYAPAQIDIWVSYGWNVDAWAKRFLANTTYVAVEGDCIIGFADIEPNGHIGFFYCHHLWQRKGVGTALYTALERSARELHLAKLYAEVSVSAQHFFTAMGYETLAMWENTVAGLPARQFIMQKAL